MEQKLDAANAKLDELLEVHKDEPMTTNHYFMDTRKELQRRKIKDELKGMLDRKLTKPNQKIGSEDISQIMSMIAPEVNPDMDMVAAEDAFDNMNAYYKVLNFLTSNRFLERYLLLKHLMSINSLLISTSKSIGALLLISVVSLIGIELHAAQISFLICVSS